ncbi:hypothetical protein DFQ29_003222 [Apophysomyces sp. BC1021]|nr:hypothetical protein DFQ29_003222 [Apophysomyces sp. BC1021]
MHCKLTQYCLNTSLPTDSPELNPVEQSWALVKGKLKREHMMAEKNLSSRIADARNQVLISDIYGFTNRSKPTPEQLRGTITDCNAPGLRFNGIIRKSFINGQGKNIFKVVLDILLDAVIDLAPTCLRLEERRQRRVAPRSNRIPPVKAGQAANILEGALEEEEQKDEEVVDATWVESAITVDV